MQPAPETMPAGAGEGRDRVDGAMPRGALKIVLFTDANVFAGTERHMLDLARGLRNAGAQPLIASPAVSALAQRAGEEGIPHVAIEKGGAIDWKAILTLRRMLRAGRIDLVHAHNGRTALSAALAVKLAGRGAYVLTQHFLLPSRAGRRGLKASLSSAVHRWISRGAEHIIAISDATRRGIEARGEAAAANVTTVPNGIPAPAPASLVSAATIRANLRVLPGQPLIVCAARLEPEKDVASLVAAMPAVLAAVPNAVCVVAGEGSQREALTAQIESLGLRDSVRLAGFCTDALSLMRAADLFVLPSLAEPFGLVIIEAMSLAVPVIGTDAGGPREIIENGVSGLLAPPADPAGLAAAIARLLTDEPLRAKLGRQGLERFRRHYKIERMAGDILAIYRSALRLGPASGKPGLGARRKPRVLLISHTCQTRAEGQPKAEQIAGLGEVDLLVLAPGRFNHFGVWKNAEPPANPAYRFDVLPAAWRWLGPAQNYLHWYPSLGTILREFQPDIIDLWEEPWSLVSAQACWLRNRLLPHARIVMESEQNILKRWPPPFRWIENYTIRNASSAVGRSNGVIDVLRAKNYRGPAEVVGNAVDTTLFRPMDRDQCKRGLGFEGFTVGYVGRLVERKGLMDLVDAISHCDAGVHAVFVGSGEFQSALEARVEALDLTERVRFLPARPLEELPPVMNALDAFVLPSWTVPTWKEQFGRVIIEAHACQTPVIGSDSGAIPDVIGEGGFVYPERDVNKLAAAITQLRADPVRGREMGAAGRRQVEARYTWRQVARQMTDIYFRALGEERAGAAGHGHGGGGAFVNGSSMQQNKRKPVTVLFLDHTAKLGGGEIALFHLLTRLDRTKFRPVAVIGQEGPLAEKLRDAGVDTTVLPLAPQIVDTRKDSLGANSLLKLRAIFTLLGYTRRLSRLIKARGAELVHTNSLKADLIGGVAGRLARVPVVWHIRDRIEDDYLPGPVAWLFRGLCRVIPHFVVANSGATLATLRLPGHQRNMVVHSGYAAPVGTAAVVHDGVEPHSISGRVHPDAPIVGLVGRITRWKGQHVFLDAMATVRRRFPNVRCRIIGSAIFGEEAYEREIRTQADQPGLKGAVEFLGFRTDIQQCVHELDILVHASITGEPFGQVIVEAMIGARPVVATRGGGVPEIVQDGITGYLVPMGDAGAMAEAICKLLEDPEQARIMGLAGRARAMNNFTVELTAQRLGRVFDVVLQRSGRLAAPAAEAPVLTA